MLTKPNSDHSSALLNIGIIIHQWSYLITRLIRYKICLNLISEYL